MSGGALCMLRFLATTRYRNPTRKLEVALSDSPEGTAWSEEFAVRLAVADASSCEGILWAKPLRGVEQSQLRRDLL